MKKIGDYRRVMGVTKSAQLSDLKTIYRGFMKEYHPDKFANDETAKQEAELKSQEIIEAYAFLVSIDPETQEQFKEDYIQTTTAAVMSDFNYENSVLKVSFTDRSVYEYYDVPKNTYVKMVNATSPGRFARRSIFNSFPYRNVQKASAE
jgi:DnaJ-class molecular chaperone